MSESDALAGWIRAQLEPIADAEPLDLDARYAAALEAQENPVPQAARSPRTRDTSPQTVQVPRAAWPTVYAALTKWGARFTAATSDDSRAVIVQTDTAGAKVARRYAQVAR